MATLVATYDYETHGADFCARTGLADGAEAEALLASACVFGDQYLANPFDGSDALSPETHPLGIWEGIVAWAKAAQRMSSANAGVTAASTGALSEQYATGLDPTRVPVESAKIFWWPWKRAVWR